MEGKTILKIIRAPNFDLSVLVENPINDAETSWDLSKDMEKLVEKEFKERLDDPNVARVYDLLKIGLKYR